jgi:hypothetical protein
MSAEKTPEWLVDLLYVGEEEDEAGASPPELELSDEERRQLDRSRALLREVREHCVLASPREAVRASILEQARKAAAASVVDVAQAEGPIAATKPGQRDARAPRGASGGLWSRGRTNSVAQIVAVALALVASAALLSRFQINSQRAASFDPMAEMATNKPAPATAAPQLERPADTVALKEVAPAPAAVAEPQPDPSIVEMKPVEDQAASGAVAKNGADQQREAAIAEARRDAKASAPPKAPQEPLRALKDNLAGEDALDGYPKEGAKTAGGAGRTVIASADAPTMLDGDGVVLMREREVPPTPQAPKADHYFNSPESKADDVRLEVSAAKEMNAAPAERKKTFEAPPSAPPADEVEDEASSKPPTAAKPAAKPAQEKAADKESAGPGAATPAAIRASYNRADYRGTISGADMFLSAGLGTPDQRAEIMDLKAQALEQLGRGAEADALLREIERQYPDYYRKNNLAKRKPSPVRKQKSRSIQFDEAASPDSMQSY